MIAGLIQCERNSPFVVIWSDNGDALLLKPFTIERLFHRELGAKQSYRGYSIVEQRFSGGVGNVIFSTPFLRWTFPAF